MNQIRPKYLFKFQVSSPPPHICFIYCSRHHIFSLFLIFRCSMWLTVWNSQSYFLCIVSVLVIIPSSSCFPILRLVIQQAVSQLSNIVYQHFFLTSIVYHLGMYNWNFMKTDLIFLCLTMVHLMVTQTVFARHFRTITLREICILSKICTHFFSPVNADVSLSGSYLS